MTTVWAVEDNALYRSTLVELIDRQDGLSCPVAVPDAETLVALLDERDAPDVILLDIGLPGTRGVDAIVPIRVRAPATRIVMLTVHDAETVVFEALRAGADGYLLKSAGRAEIVAAIELVLQGGAPINAFIARRLLDALRTRPSDSLDGRDAVVSEGLTPRELEILQGLASGQSQKQVAAAYGISYHTVDTHVRKIYEKLQVTSRGAAVAEAIRKGLVREPGRIDPNARRRR